MNFKPFTVASLILALIAIAMGWYWPWGILLLKWIWDSFSSGETYFVEKLNREENAVLFWVINLMWLIFAIAAFAYEFRPDLFPA
ncbi:MAG: hypothetical protein AAF423_01155 [Pseudomonadota bacterium]